MKCSAAIAALTMAVAAIAAPADIEVRTGSSTCNSNQKQVCCNGILGCAVQVLGVGCSGGSYCCETEAPVGSLINLALLNCVSL
ncbi:Fc.00g094520.m01.CDS01 [Cosmosporella sp. VM-42]